MFGTTGSWRLVIGPAALVAIGVALPREQRTAIPPAPALPAPILDVADATTAMDDKPPPFDVVKELRAIGEQAQREIVYPPDAEGLIPAAGACTRPTASTRAKLRKRLGAWIDDTYADERSGAADDLELRVGCTDPDGLIVDMNVDRGRWDDKHAWQSRWWIVRVTEGDITVVAERTSTAKDDWMEWADEGWVAVLALVDLDRDGVRDIAWTNTEHEGGASASSYDVAATLSATGATQPILSMHGTLSAQITRRQLVLGLGQEDVVYRCVNSDLKLARCAAGDQLRARDDRAAIAERLMSVTASQLPDRDQLAGDLATLGVAAPAVLAAVPPTPPEVRAQRHVAAFIAHLRSDDPIASVTQATHEVAQRYFEQLRSELGDTACAPEALTADDITRVNTWIGAQPRPPKSPPQAIDIEPACGSYVWASWETWTTHAGVRHETLLVLDREITSVVSFELEATGGGDMEAPSGHTATFVRHGDTIVGMVIHTGGTRSELLAIAHGRVVATKTGEFERYTFDRRWSDASDDVVVDSHGVWWHATETGLERVSSPTLRSHEARRAAIELLEDGGSNRVHALVVLGAPAALVREVAQLEKP